MIHSLITHVIAATLYLTSAALAPHHVAHQVALTKTLPQQAVNTSDEKDASISAEQEAEKEDQAYLQRIGYLPSTQTATTAPTVSPVVAVSEASPVVTSASVTVASTAAVAPTSFADVYKQAAAKYGVPWQILYGLHQTETGGRDGAISSGHGPEGPMQFMPGTFAAYAVDGNGDGHADIDNAVDAIYTAANFIAKHGSVPSALASWGGNTYGTLSLARQQGYSN